jgi:hypothetical protein
MDITSVLSKYAGQPLSTQVLLGLLKTYQRPYDKIVELINKGHLVQLRKGLYMTSLSVSLQMPEPFLIANHLYGPSYVSLDSAMFYWGLIPERVYEITSVTTRISKRIETGNVIYSFTHLPISYYPLGILSVSLSPNQTILMASPEKCLCDKIITTSGINLRSKKQTMEFLVEDLRIEKDSLREMNLREMVQWLPSCPKNTSIKILIETISEL